jgi:hypothetical protein
MSTLDSIIAEVSRRGHYDINLAVLTPAYFSGDDRIEQIANWAESQGLRVIYSPSMFYECDAKDRQVTFYPLSKR